MKQQRPLNKIRPRSKRLTQRVGGVYQLRIEPLEARRLLAGIQVSVFVDQDGSRSYDETADSQASNRLVYLDLDRSGAFESGEPIQVTDDEGIAFFDELDIGDYRVGMLTNPGSQLQTTSTHVASSGTQLAGVSVTTLLADPQLEHAWAVSPNGIANRVHEQTDAPEQEVALGGVVVDSITEGNQALLLVNPSSSTRQALVEFNLETGELSVPEVQGLATEARILKLARSSTETFALLETDSGTALASISLSSGSFVLTQQLTENTITFAASPSSDSIAIVSRATDGTESSEVRLKSSAFAEHFRSSIVIDGIAESMTFARGGTLLLVTMQGGGINAIRVEEGSLTLDAILADATGPVSAVSTDGRLVTGSTRRQQEVIVWDSFAWTPIARSVVGGQVTSVLTDAFGEQALAAGPNGIYAIALATPDTQRTSVSSDDSVSELHFGVRLSGQNSPPNVNVLPSQIIAEDSESIIDWQERPGASDADGDQLWYTLLSAPSHGTLELSAGGIWTYRPADHFNGDDFAVVSVHDGLDSSELVLRWQITAINDPPQGIFWQMPAVAENLPIGSSLGFVSVADADRDAHYRVTTSDPRFRVSDGQIFLSEGELDFDTEPNVTFELLATDVDNPDYSISTLATLRLTNVNEAPTKLKLDSSTVAENDLGGIVGRVLIDDPDAGDEYDLSTSDDRFEVRDGVLKLVDGQELDFEEEDTIALTITATESGGEARTILSESFSLSVIDTNDSPTELILDNLTIEADRPGAVVGRLTVDDPDGDRYVYAVSDERFQVVDGFLQLRDNTQFEYFPASSVSVTVVATAVNGDRATAIFPLLISPPRPPHQNPNNPSDVNGDGQTTPMDALIIINEINQNGGGILPPAQGEGTGEAPPTMPDVNGDGVLSPLDVLIIINELNNRGMGGEGEQSQPSLNPTRARVEPLGFSLLDVERRRFQNSQIDAELETLLEELSKHRLNG